VVAQETWSSLVGAWVEWRVPKVAPGLESISRHIAVVPWQH
jgi:hypothetical protein